MPRLLSWYGAQARDLPWRHTRDPYAIWISEIMLQQTQVATVIPYWERWMRALPTVSHLALAKPERVLKLWEGLGYYSRARNLQAAARKILNDYQGQFPTTPEAIRTLPGIGRYTTGAISSIAFNLPEPIVDGNVIRILTRLFGQRENPKTKALQNELWSLADTLVRSTKDCAALNQALMELGATVCHPRSPNCTDCPVKRSCTARKEKAIHLIPATSARPRTEARRIEVYWIARGDRILLQQRPKGFHNAGFGNSPTTKPAPTSRSRPNLSLSPPCGTRLQSTASSCSLTPLTSPAPSKAAGASRMNWSLFPLPLHTENFCANWPCLTGQHK